MGYYRATYSFGTTGNKTLVLDLGGTPIGCRITAGPRNNTTESSELFCSGGSDGTNTHCITTAPGFSKKWPYTAESSYLFAVYSNSTTKVLSGTFTSFGDDELNINVDAANANYPIIVEVWN